MKQTKAVKKRRIAAQKVKPRKVDPILTITLQRSHQVGSTFYGPGKVTVKRSLAYLLLEQERNARMEDARFYDPDPAGTIIGAQRRLIKVPGSQFNDYMVHAPAVGEISGRAQ